MDKGFFHPSRGYWQTIGEPPQHILDGYPEGTVEVPLKPGADHEWNGKEWLPPGLEIRKAEARDRLAAIRYARETGGTTVNGMAIHTDDRSKELIWGMANRAVPHFKAAPGRFIALDKSQTGAIAEAVAQHVQACFSREAELDAEIAAATTVEELEKIDLNTGWPEGERP